MKVELTSMARLMRMLCFDSYVYGRYSLVDGFGAAMFHVGIAIQRVVRP